MDWRRSRFTRHHNMLTGKAPITGPIIDSGRTAGKKVGRKVAGGEIVPVGGKEFVTVNSNTAQVFSLTDLTGGAASAPQAGDFVMVFVGRQNTALGTVAVSSGYTQRYAVDTQDGSGLRNQHFCFYKRLTAADTEVTVQQVTGSSEMTVVILVFRGVSEATPFDVADAAYSVVDGGTINPAAITPVTQGAMLVAAGSSGLNATVTNFTSPDLDGFRSIFNTINSFKSTTGAGYKAWDGLGPFDPAVWGGGNTGANGSGSARTIALRPA